MRVPSVHPGAKTRAAMPIFISYSSKDQKTAEAICEAIEHRGHPCWISSRDIGPGENFQAQVVRAIRNAKIMVLVFSSNANNSEEIKKELVLAGQSRLVVIPVRVEDVAPDEAFAYEFATRQWIDVFGDWEHAIQRVVHQIEAVDGEQPAASAMPAAQAPQAAEPAPPPQPPPAASAPAATPGGARTASRMAGLLGAAVAIIVILAGVVVWQLWPKPAPPPAPPATASRTPPAAAPAPRAAENPSGQAPIAIPPASSVAPPPAPPGSVAAATPNSPPNSPGPTATTPPAPASSPQPEPATPAAGAAAAATPGSTFRDCPNCPDMVVIPAGSFQMGAAPGESARYQVPTIDAGRDEPQHKVTLAKPFALAKFDVTRGEFAAFARATGFQPRPGCQTVVAGEWMPQLRASWEEPGYAQTDRDPVVCMNQLEILAFLRWLHNATGKDYRLPSEAEWEYAQRAGTTTAFYWGNDPKGACLYENIGDEAMARRSGNRGAIGCNDRFPGVAPVGSFKPNPFGLFDMAGNIFVFTADCWNEGYAGAPSDGSAWMTGDCTRHVARKVGFGTVNAWMLRSANRHDEGDFAKRNRFGFRVALSLP